MCNFGLEQRLSMVDHFGVHFSETEVGDGYEGEIVPDSDDEGTHRGEVLADGTGLLSSCQLDGNAQTKTIAIGTKRRLCNLRHSALKCAEANAFCIEDKDHVLVNLELHEDVDEEDNSGVFQSSGRITSDHYTGVVKMQKESIVDSVDFVDQCLSAHFGHLAPSAASVIGEKSQSSISNAKGLQSSIARLAFLKSKVKDEGVFKWVDDLEENRKPNHSNHLLPGSMSVEDMNLRKQRIYPTNQCLDINEKLGEFSISSGRMPISGVRRTSNDELQPKLESGEVSSKELNKVINKESHSSELEVSVEDKDADFYEVGIGTQIAAEAMEALYHADLPSDDLHFSLDTPVVSINHKNSTVCSEKQRRKSCTSLQDSNSGDDSCQDRGKKVRTHYKRRTKGNLKGVVQSKNEKNIRKRAICKGNSGSQCEKFLPVSRGAKQLMPFDKSLNLSMTSDGDCQNGVINLKVEDASSRKKRERMDLFSDNRVVYLQTLNLLDYPRRKRTVRTSRVKIDSCMGDGGFSYPVKLLNRNECSMPGIRTQGSLESEPFPFRCPIKRKKRTPVCRNSQGKNEDEIVHEHDSIVKGGKVIGETSLKSGAKDQFRNQCDKKSSSSLCQGKDGVSIVKSYNSVSLASSKCSMSNELHLVNTIRSHRHQPEKEKESSSLLTKELVRLGCVESMPDIISKDLRRRRTMANIQVLLSQSLENDIFKQQKKILAWFGVPMASCPSDATHFVADRFTRTRNMLEIIALGKPVVTHLWLESCKEAGFCINERKYILRDVKKEQELGFSLQDSLIQAGRQPLLRGYKVYVTPNVKPAQDIINSLVNTLRGEQVVDPACGFQSEDVKLMENFLILSCEEDYAHCIPFLQKGATAYTSELLLNGVIIQKLEFQRHKLFFNQLEKSSIKLIKDTVASMLHI